MSGQLQGKAGGHGCISKRSSGCSIRPASLFPLAAQMQVSPGLAVPATGRATGNAPLPRVAACRKGVTLRPLGRQLAVAAVRVRLKCSRSCLLSLQIYRLLYSVSACGACMQTTLLQVATLMWQRTPHQPPCPLPYQTAKRPGQVARWPASHAAQPGCLTCTASVLRAGVPS